MNAELRRLVREELLRSIAWIGLGIVGWPILIEEVAWLDATVLTVFGLPVLTWGVLTAGAIGIRAVTARDLQVQTPTGLSVSLAFGIMLGGIAAVYLVANEGYSALWVSAAYVAVTTGTVLWHWYLRQPDSSLDTPI
ncbi:MAG: hypothetical protein ACI8XM_000922 [Haloarculaceae archaeon]|jgi:hypothetical protein